MSELRRGEAGRTGDKVRGDLHATLEETSGGGVTIELESKVELYYGDTIREQARSLLAELGVDNAKVTVTDGGALPFVIGARIEAAARRAGLVTDPLPAGATAADREPSARQQLRRSRLYLPGNEPKYMPNAALHGPDAVILDLEDSVHPAEKDTARLLVRGALQTIDFGRVERMVRINQLPLGLEDLDFIVPACPDLILIPKVEHGDQVREVDQRIDEIFARLQWQRPIWLMPILESALGIENAFDIAGASERLVALTLGLEDLTADLGVPKTVTGEESLFARMRTANAARAAGLQAIDSVFGDVNDLDGLEAWGRRSRAMGYEGMGCVHPRQIEVIHRAFAPSDAELQKAQRIVGAFQQAEAQGLGVVSLGSKMIDPPVVNRALKLLEHAKAMGLVPSEGGQS